MRPGIGALFGGKGLKLGHVQVFRVNQANAVYNLDGAVTRMERYREDGGEHCAAKHGLE